jgi:hypothetical protein
MSPPLTDFTLVGTQTCVVWLEDNIHAVSRTLSINVLNRAPYLSGTIPGQTVALNGHLVVDPSLYFRDDDGHSLTISVAYYTFNGVTSSIPGSIFTFASTTQIQVDPTAFLEVGTYIIDVIFTDTSQPSDVGSFSVEVTNTAPRFSSVMPTVSAPVSATTNINIGAYIIDDEANPITVTLTSTYSGVVSTFPTPIFSQPTTTTLLIYPPTSTYYG